MKHPVTGKILVRGLITNTSPLLVASGSADTEDFEVILDEDGRPFIPASGFAGMLRAAFRVVTGLRENLLLESFLHFWGSETEDDPVQSQSHLVISDLLVREGYGISIRDGVSICPEKGVALPQKKYDYQLLEPGAVFEVTMEITLREGFNKVVFLQFLDLILTRGGGEIPFRTGAFKNAGFGELEWKDANVYDFPLGTPKKAETWFQYIKSEGTKLPEPIYTMKAGWSSGTSVMPLPLKPEATLLVSGEFSLESSLIIMDQPKQEDYGADEKLPDKVHLLNKAKQPLLPGKSIRGAIRHRAKRICSTLLAGNSVTEKMINQLFGYVDEDKRLAASGRIRTPETILAGSNGTQRQPRVKIDRFTGGSFESALMEIQPLWHDKEKFSLSFEVRNASRAEAAVLLLVMKDLFHSDLAVGGVKSIGKGVLRGHSLKVKGWIKEREGNLNLSFDKNGLTGADHQLVEELNSWCKEIQLVNYE